jgi:hypothetical protein
LQIFFLSEFIQQQFATVEQQQAANMARDCIRTKCNNAWAKFRKQQATAEKQPPPCNDRQQQQQENEND